MQLLLPLLILLTSGTLRGSQVTSAPAIEDSWLTPELQQKVATWRPAPVQDPEGPFALWNGEDPEHFLGSSRVDQLFWDRRLFEEHIHLEQLATRDAEKTLLMYDIAKLTVSKASDDSKSQAERVTAWIELAESKARFHLKRGEFDLAQAALTEPMFRPGEIEALVGRGSEVLVEADAAWSKAWAKRGPSLGELWVSAEAGREAQVASFDPLEALDAAALAYLLDRFGAPSPVLDKQVAELLHEGATESLQDLGPRATPSLVLRVLADLEEPAPLEPGFDKYRVDPLEALLGCDQGAGLVLLDAWAERGNSNWRRRVLGCMESSFRWDDPRLWRLVGRAEDRVEPNYPGLLRIVEALVRDPRTLESGLELVGELTNLDALDAGLQDALEGVVRGSEANLALRVLSAISARGAETLKPIYLAGLASAHPEVRRSCARELRIYGQTEAWFDRVGDPDPEVRRALLDSLDPDRMDDSSRHVRVSDGRVGVRLYNNYPNQKLLPEAEAVFEALLEDPDPTIRIGAIEMLSWSDRATEERFRTALTDSDPQVRRAAVKKLEIQGYADLVAELAAGVDRDLLEELDARLAREWRSLDEESALRILGARAKNATVPMQLPTHFVAADALDWSGVPATALGPLLAAGLEQGRTDYVEFCLQGFERLRISYKRPRPEQLDAFDAYLSTEAWTHLGARSQGVRQWVEQATLAGVPAARRIKLALANATSLPIWIRADLLTMSGPPRAEDELAVLHDLLVEMGRLESSRQAFHDWLDRANQPLANDVAFAFFERVAADPAVRDFVLEALTYHLPQHVDPPESTAMTLYQRVLDGKPAARTAVGNAIGVLLRGTQRERVLSDVPTLLGGRQTVRSIVTALAGDGAAQHVEVFERVLADGDHPTDVQQAAISGLRTAGTPEAEDVLRRSVVRVDSIAISSLESALAAFERQRELDRDARADRSIGSDSEAMAALVEMLSSDAPRVRAEAARGLAAFGALEALPRLIPLLEDPVPEVAHQAADALDRLHELAAGNDARTEDR